MPSVTLHDPPRESLTITGIPVPQSPADKDTQLRVQRRLTAVFIWIPVLCCNKKHEKINFFSPAFTEVQKRQKNADLDHFNTIHFSKNGKIQHLKRHLKNNNKPFFMYFGQYNIIKNSIKRKSSVQHKMVFNELH